jgi:hypothetical protein
MKAILLPLCAAAFSLACSGSDSKEGSKPEGEGPDPGAVDDGCERSKIEPDLGATPMSGSKVDTSGVLAEPGPGGYVVSSTFLRLRPGEAVTTRFGELSGPIIAGLPARPGLAGFQLGLAPACNVARTLSVWESEEAMYDFVVSDEHITAVSAVSEVSRGASVVVHWTAESAADATWERAGMELAAAKGPFY